MDIAAAISANRHCRRVVVTAAVNNVSFDNPIQLADIVIIESQVTRSFKSSMEVLLEVFVEDSVTGKKTQCNQAMYTFVAVDQQGAPIVVPELIPETDLEKERFKGALRRRQLRLVLAGKIKPKDATELRAIFE
jgi:acyl-CoA hydrolase